MRSLKAWGLLLCVLAAAGCAGCRGRQERAKREALEALVDLADIAQSAATYPELRRYLWKARQRVRKAYQAAGQQGVPVRIGTVLTSDTFYSDDPQSWKIWAKYGVLAEEMETAALYTLTAGHGAQGLSILTISDSLVTKERASSEQRQRSYTDMMELALQVATS